MPEIEEWRPGSFTKNFSWGPRQHGLLQLYDIIRIGFKGILQDVPREEFRARVRETGRPDYIPINFFLFNRRVSGADYIIADELVFQALTSNHSAGFDKLALFAFNLSFAGKWNGASPYQRRPALWAHHYIRDRVAKVFSWSTERISVNDIEDFVGSDPRYRAATTRKLATNLNYLYEIGRLSEFDCPQVERWWVDALFLTLDRLIEDRRLEGTETPEGDYGSLLAKSGFRFLSGRSSLEKDLATRHLLTLYTACGGRERFSDEAAKTRTLLKMADLEWLEANDDRPQGAVHITNARILKVIPRSCAMLARYAGFEVIDADELLNFDAEEFVRRHTRLALDRLQQEGALPTLTAEDLMRITRDR